MPQSCWSCPSFSASVMRESRADTLLSISREDVAVETTCELTVAAIVQVNTIKHSTLSHLVMFEHLIAERGQRKSLG